MADSNTLRKFVGGIKASPDVTDVIGEIGDKINKLIKEKKPIPQELIDQAESQGANQAAAVARMHNAGGDPRDIALPASQSRGMTRAEAKEVRKTIRADEIKDETERLAQLDQTIDARFADERAARIDEMRNFRKNLSSKENLDKFKKEAQDKGLKGTDVNAYVNDRIDQETNKFFQSTSKDVQAEMTIPDPIISQGGTPLAGRPRETEGAKALRTKSEQKRTAEEARKAQAAPAPVSKPLSAEKLPTAEARTIPSAGQSVVVNPAKQNMGTTTPVPEAQKLKNMREQFEQDTTPAAPAAAPETADFKGKSLKEVQSMVEQNPNLKQAAIDYAKTKEKKAWQNWASETQATATKAEAPAAPAPATAPAAPTTKAPKVGKGGKAAAPKQVADTLQKTEQPEFVSVSTGQKVDPEEAAILKQDLEVAKKEGPEALQRFSNRLGAIGIGVGAAGLAGGGFLYTQAREEASQQGVNSLIRGLDKLAPVQPTAPATPAAPAAPANLQTQQIAELQNQLRDPNKSPEAKKAIQAALDRMQGTKPPAPEVPAAPAEAPAKSKAASPFAAEKPSDVIAFYKKIQEVATPMSQLDKETRTRLEGLESTLNSRIEEAKTLYEQTVEKARTDADRREAMLTWASIGEQLGQAITQYFAAREGQRLGARIGSQMKFQKHDWAGDLDRSLKKMESQLSGAKEKYGIVSKEVEAGREALSKERAGLEKTAQARAEGFVDVATRDFLAKQRAGEEATAQSRRFAFEKEQQERRIEAETQREEERTKRAEAKSAAQVREEQAKLSASEKKAYKSNFSKLSGAAEALAKKDTPDNRKALRTNAELLGIPPAEIDELIDETTGEGAFQWAESEKVTAILDKYRPAPEATEDQAGVKKPPPKVGDIREGYRYKGKDPAKASSWEKVQ